MEAFADMVDATQSELATKSDLKAGLDALEHRFDLRFAKVDTEILLMKWMLGFVLAGVGSLVLKAFFHA